MFWGHDWIDFSYAIAGIGASLVTVLCALGYAIVWLIRSQVRQIQELTPNHGTSLRDAVDRIETKLDNHIHWHLEKNNG